MEGDDADPPTVYAVSRPIPRRSTLLVQNLNFFLSSEGCNGAALWLVRLKDLEKPVPLDVCDDARVWQRAGSVNTRPWLASWSFRRVFGFLQELTGLLAMLSANAALLSKAFVRKFVPLLYDACVCVVSALSEDSLRALGKDFAPEITSHLRVLLRRVYSREETGKRVEVSVNTWICIFSQ